MTTKMVSGFRRSLSFPNPPNSSSRPKKTFHVRSTSLPCRSHPLIFQLKDELNQLTALSSKPETRNSAWLIDSLAQLKTVHESLDDLLQLPQTRESLNGHNAPLLIENLLEDFLRFVDVYGIFQTLILRLKEEHQAAHVAARRKDANKLASYSKSVKKIGKELEKLIAGLPKPAATAPDSGDVVEVVEIMDDVARVTVVVTTALLNGLAAAFTFPKSTCGPRWMVGGKKVNMEEGIEEFKEMGVFWGLRRKGEEDLKMVLKKMHELEDCIGGIESGGEKVFRSLINARVSLLNVFTQ